MATTDGTVVGQTYAERGRAASWGSAWPDALAFVVGLGAAWRGGWNATDLVWSLWLSSLVVGYSIIVWSIARPVVDIARGVWRDADQLDPVAVATAGPLLLLGALFVLAFFTVHFGLFHYVHSQFLAAFFPVDAGHGRIGGAGTATYLTVAHRYWRFLPAAFLAERGAFARTAALPLTTLRVADRAAAADAVRRDPSGEKKGPQQSASGGAMTAPYRNVVRMHVLIIFFAFTHFVRLDNFAVYAIIYAAYFFPWRLVKREG